MDNILIRKFQGQITKRKELTALVEMPDEKKYPCPAEKYPALFYLHSAGERYMPEHELDMVSLTKYVNGPMVFVTPHCPRNNVWEPDAVRILAENIVKEYPVDPKRLYLTGFSMGGRGVWDTILEHPDVFAAAAPLAGFSCYLRASRIKDLPIWAFHGIYDSVVPFKESRKMIDALRDLGNDAKFGVLKADHGIEHEVYGDIGLFEWFLKQQKK
jgi:hypothetical protein